MKKPLSTAVVFIFFFLSMSAYAETFTAHCRDYPPELSFEDNKCIGAIPDLITDILNELGHEIIWIKTPWIRSIAEAKTGKVDLLIRHSMTEERELFLHPMPYGNYTRKVYFFKSPAFDYDVNSYDDIKKHIVGAIRGNFYSPNFAKLDTKTLVLVGKTEQLVNMLERGRIDLAVTSKSHSEYLFRDRFVQAKFVDAFYNPLFISIPKKSKASKYYQDINQLLLEYRKSGKINQYFDKYGLTPPKQIFE